MNLQSTFLIIDSEAVEETGLNLALSGKIFCTVAYVSLRVYSLLVLQSRKIL